MNIQNIEKNAAIKYELESFEDEIIQRISFILNHCGQSFPRNRFSILSKVDGIKNYESEYINELISYDTNSIVFNVSDYIGCGEYKTIEHTIPTKLILGDDYNDWSIKTLKDIENSKTYN
jgi:hypothetical protein